MYGLSDTVITDICGVFRRHPNIEKVLIFGSRAKVRIPRDRILTWLRWGMGLPLIS